MIVECKQCQTRFRMADEKILPGGVKVRCSKCQHTFVVKRDKQAQAQQVEMPVNTSAADGPSEEDGANEWPKAPTMQLFAVSPADVNKAAAAASAKQVEKTEISPPSDFMATALAPNPLLANPDAFAQKIANEKTEVSDPFSLPQASPAQRQAADDPFGLPDAPPEYAAPAASELNNPFAVPAPATTADSPAAMAENDPFAIAAPPPAPVDEIAGMPDPFSEPPGPDAMGDPLAASAGLDAPVVSADDLFAGLGLPMDSPSDGMPFEQDDRSAGFADGDVEAQTRVRTVDDDMLQMLASYSEDEQEQEKIVDQGQKKQSEKAAKGASDSAEKSQYLSPWMTHSLQAVAGLAVAVGLLLLLFQFRGGQFSNLAPKHFFNVVMFGELGQVIGGLRTRSVEVQSYPVSNKQRRVLVLGEVENKGQREVPAVLVSATLFAKDGTELEQAQAYAGAGSSPFELRAVVAGHTKLAKKLKAESAHAQGLAVDQNMPFVVAFSSSADKALGGKVQLNVRAADAVSRSALAPQKQADGLDTKAVDSPGKTFEPGSKKKQKTKRKSSKKTRNKKRQARKPGKAPEAPPSPPPPPPPSGL